MNDSEQSQAHDDWERARAFWPGIDVPKDAFVAFRSALRPPPDDPQTNRSAEDVLCDIYLTCACSMGDPLAIRRFQEKYDALLERIRTRFGALAPTQDELRAEVQSHLFVARPNAPPRIVGYAGWVELGAWLKVVVTRLVLSRVTSARVDETCDDPIFEALLVTTETPEKAFLKREAEAAFRAAFRKAVRGLGGRERQLLRFAFVQRLTIDEVAALYDVHRTTAFRWIKRASDELSAALETLVRAEFGLSAQAYAEWQEALRSGLDLSIERYLNSTSDST